MKVVTYLNKFSDLDQIKDSGVDEVILCHKQLSRLGELSHHEVIKASRTSLEKKIRPVLDWDILMVDQALTESESAISKLLDEGVFEVVRVYDVGAIHTLMENFPKVKIQLILENGNHNLHGILSWCEIVGPMLDRVVLSLELPKATLAYYIDELSKRGVAVEFLGFGRIPLFYTPRLLLSSHLKDWPDQDCTPIEVRGSSEESPHRGFPIIQNQHGTFMFNTKDFCLLENIEELEEMDLKFIRVDLRNLKTSGFLLSNIVSMVKEPNPATFQLIKKLYPKKLIRGFYHANKSDAVFSKLKNSTTARKDFGHLGDVIEANKNVHLGIMLRNPKLPIKINDEIVLFTPEGKRKYATIRRLENSSGESLDHADYDQLIFINYVKGVGPRTTVYLREVYEVRTHCHVDTQ